MTAKTRIQKLEKQKPVKAARCEMSAADVEGWERSYNALADALNITRAELDKGLTELFGDTVTAKP